MKAVLIMNVDFRFRRLRFPRACRGASSALKAPAGSPLPRTPAGVFAAFRSNQHAKNQQLPLTQPIGKRGGLHLIRLFSFYPADNSIDNIKE